jgi:alpha-galactosidase/6-phospho-beta-glucosidase family protein
MHGLGGEPDVRYADAKVSDIALAYIGGGSRGWAWKLMADLALEERLGGVVRLYDADEDAARANAAIGNALRDRPEVRSRWRYEATPEPRKALEGADLVIISILPGTLAEMACDVHAPERYGIWQSVGDTVGPGGLIRSLRTIPPHVEFARWIEQWCPGAWVITYTNPMALCVRTLYEVFPRIKAFGCCHEIFGTQDLLAAMLADGEGIRGVTREEVKVNPLGINHFTWIDAASWRGTDLLPLFARFADRYGETGYRRREEEGVFGSAHRVAFDLFRRYGIIPAAGDRHIAEFAPLPYLENPEAVARWMFSLTPVSWRISQAKELEEACGRYLVGKAPFPLAPSGEEGIRQIASLLGLEEMVTNVNLPNRGQVVGIPEGAVVETNALITRDSVRPVHAGALPPDVNALVMRHVLNQETVVRAGIERDRRLAFNAFLNDPQIRLGVQDAGTLFEEMLSSTRRYLPGWKL